MKFITKFGVGELVFFMKDNVVTKAIITSVTASKVGQNGPTIIYTAEKTDAPVSWLDYQNLQEESLFGSKSGLVASL